MLVDLSFEGLVVHNSHSCIGRYEIKPPYLKDVITRVGAVISRGFAWDLEAVQGRCRIHCWALLGTLPCGWGCLEEKKRGDAGEKGDGIHDEIMVRRRERGKRGGQSKAEVGGYYDVEDVS